MCLHGFTDTWRTWELVAGALERRHDVLAPTLAGHAGGPDLPAVPAVDSLADGVALCMDRAGIDTAHIVGNSLGGYVALQLAERGRARSVVAFAPAGGWPPGDPALTELLGRFAETQEEMRAAAPNAAALLSTPEGRRRATRSITVDYEHIPVELIAHLMLGVASCRGTLPLIEVALRTGYDLDPERITCPVRIVWGTADVLLPWPDAATRFRDEWLPHADWVVLDGVGHCPQLDDPLAAAELVLGFTAR